MKKIGIVVAVGATLALIAVYGGHAVLTSDHAGDTVHLSGSVQAASDGSSNQSGTTMPSSARGANAKASEQSPWNASPFEIANGTLPSTVAAASIPATEAVRPPEKEVVSDAELARRKKMVDLGYMVPTEYYEKDLKTLKKMAKAGDAFAMVHIGEKYYFELNGQTANPEFEPGLNYPEAAKAAFKDALVAGNVRSAGIIAELYFQEKNPLEAYAWHLVSDQLGDDISADWFRRTDMAQQATPDLKQAAANRAAQIIAELKLPKKKA